MVAGSESARDLTEFRLRDAAFSVQARLRAPLWNLVQDMPAICSCVLARLAPFGVGLNDLRIDNRDGNLGEANLGFWALDLRARCSIRLADVEVQCQRTEPGRSPSDRPIDSSAAWIRAGWSAGCLLCRLPGDIPDARSARYFESSRLSSTIHQLRAQGIGASHGLGRDLPFWSKWPPGFMHHFG